MGARTDDTEANSPLARSLHVRFDESGEAWGELDSSWAQGRSVFGGLVAAFGLRALTRLPGDAPPLRSLLVQFAGPVAPGRVEAAGEWLRRGKSMVHGRVRVEQAGAPAAHLLAAFGDPRRSNLRWPADPPRDTAAPETYAKMPFIEGLTPTFTQHFDYRWISTALPFTGATEPRIEGFIRPNVPTPSDESLVVMLMDAWPAPVLPLLEAFAPASSVTWKVDLHTEVRGRASDAWWRFSSWTTEASDGYATIEARLWADDGALVASSTQLVAIFG